MEMKEEITKRFEELIQKGNQLLGTLGPDIYPIDTAGHMEVDSDSYPYWVPKVKIPEFRSWLTSASNLIHFIVSPEMPLAQDCDRLMADEHLKQGVPSDVMVLMLGLLTGAKDEWDHGLLGKIEYIVAGATFDDFLDHAAQYHKGKKKIEAAVLGSAVLEDTIKKIVQKNGIQTSGKTLEPLVNELIKANVLKPVKGKRVKANIGVRNRALHAEWDEFEITDVGDLIKGTRELIENYL